MTLSILFNYSIPQIHHFQNDVNKFSCNDYVYECKMPTMVHINNARSINIDYFHKEEWQGT